MALGSTTYTSGSGSYALPPEANRVDVILLGAGGGGGGGDGGQNTTGEGGKK
ncbi:glycine-rich domain-containing protein, partial [Mycobacteroides abscessus]